MNTPGDYTGKIEITYPDGSKEDVEVPVHVEKKTDAETYSPLVEPEIIKQGEDYDLTDNVTNLDELPEGTTVTDITDPDAIDVNTPGDYTGKIEITYPDGSKEEVEVPVHVEKKTDAEVYEPTVEDETIKEGEDYDLTDNVTNLDELPEGTTVTDITDPDAIDVNTPGDYTGKIEITYPDGSKEEVEVPVHVEKKTDAEVYEPTVEDETIKEGEDYDLTDNVTNLDELPEGTTVTDITDPDAIDVNTPGDYTGKIEITYPDGSKEEVEVPVHVEKKTDAETYSPLVEPEIIKQGENYDLTDNVTNLDELPEGTTVTDITDPDAIDVNTPGNYEGKIKVTYPDGSSEVISVPVTVEQADPIITDADRYDPTSSPEVVFVNDAYDLSDNILNIGELPQGTTITDITTAENVDTTTPGNYTGLVLVSYPDGSSEEVQIPIVVIDRGLPEGSDADRYTPVPMPEIINQGERYDLTDNIANVGELPVGTVFADVTAAGTIDVNTPGNYIGSLEVTYPDGSSEVVNVPVVILPMQTPSDKSEADQYSPRVDMEVVEQDGVYDLTDNVNNMSELPAGTTVIDTTPAGAIDTSVPGNYVGTIDVVYPDGSVDSMIVPVTVTSRKPTDAEQYIPEVEKEIIEVGGKYDLTDNVTNISSLPQGTIVEDITPEGVVNVSKVGTYDATIKVVYPDGSFEILKVEVEVRDKDQGNTEKPGNGNENKHEYGNGSGSSKPSNKNGKVQTGQELNTNLWLSMMVAAMSSLGLGILTTLKNKKKVK